MPRVTLARGVGPFHLGRQPALFGFHDPVHLRPLGIAPETQLQGGRALPDRAEELEADELREQRTEDLDGRARALLRGGTAHAEVKEEVAGGPGQPLSRATLGERLDSLGDQAILEDLVVARDRRVGYPDLPGDAPEISLVEFGVQSSQVVPGKASPQEDRKKSVRRQLDFPGDDN